MKLWDGERLSPINTVEIAELQNLTRNLQVYHQAW
ncbi:hypothetical protein BDA96_10G228800 [Sorghum bicolor]|uniref:Uncharacterized protein n=2 Tax=Sorghum bicolor TaxID=4558 RepID=A0A921Q5R7_SORBI|nr:hypothetical protein BDA96_10G228800 [Sorghum bicolor]OQU76604.1 hypothetical protein SORBI_3010G173550 [Sorghum bicolor]